jgi:hypothetical protein
MGCPLCGEHHEAVFHSYPGRKVRWDRGEHPYSIRFLPPNVIPRSPLLIDKLLAVIGNALSPDEVDLEAACLALACVDLRTALKHVRYVFATATVAATLALRLASSLKTGGEDPAIPPGTGPLRTLGESAWPRLVGALKSRFGSRIALGVAGLCWVVPGIGRCLTLSIGRVSGGMGMP